MSLKLLLPAVLLLGSTLSAQVDLFTLNTASTHPVLVPDAPDNTFGVTMDPDGVHCWVTVSGALSFSMTGTQNNRLLKIDVNTMGIVGQALVGFYPEDVALHLDPMGQTDRVYVADSSDGTISVVSAGLTPLATLPLGLCFPGFGHFPFQLAFSADGNTLYAGTLGCGSIFAIDTDASSPGFHTVTTLINYNGAHGSVAVHPGIPGRLLVGSSVEFGGFAGTQSTLDVVDTTTTPPTVTVITTGPQTVGDFASISDIRPLSGGRVLAVENSQTAARLYEIDVATQTVIKTHDLAMFMPGLAFLHQADVHPAGRIVAVTSLVRDVIYWDLGSENVVGRLTYVGFPQPSDVAFTVDGSRNVVTFQNDEAVRFIGQIPVALNLTLIGTPALGQTIAFDCTGGAPFDAEAILFSTVGPGPEFLGGFRVGMSQPIGLLGFAFNDFTGHGVMPVLVPSAPAFIGVTAWLQAFTLQPSLRLSNSLTLTVVP